MKQPKITVVVTVYNIAEYLPRFFESLAKQTFGDYKLLVIDDGSTDNSLEICLSYAKRDPRIEVHSLDHIGIAAARNYSMELLDTEYTAHADGDDYVEPEYLEHLWNAQQKYNADWVLSRIAYHLEGVEGIADTFTAIGERCIPKADFPKELPFLLDNSRLNYLYGKLYKTELFKECRVEPDVKQGSDTMLNCQYLQKIKSLAIIDDIDYHYFKYRSRSVTSYSGKDAFARILRIDSVLLPSMEGAGLLNDEMLFAIHKRILWSVPGMIDRILQSDESLPEKEEQIDTILQNERYKQAFDWLKGHGFGEKELTFEPIPPQSGRTYYKHFQKEQRTLRIKAKILSICPKFILDWRERRYEKRR